MNKPMSQFIMQSVPNQERFNALLGRMFDLTQPDAVYSAPATQGDTMVINASELSASFGAGFGGGGGIDEREDDGGFGGGGGGGGFTTARPVATIEIGPRGVIVHPVVDVTKVAIAALTAVGGLALAAMRMKRFQLTGKLD